jgi:hypothetical protein
MSAICIDSSLLAVHPIRCFIESRFKSVVHIIASCDRRTRKQSRFRIPGGMAHSAFRRTYVLVAAQSHD